MAKCVLIQKISLAPTKQVQGLFFTSKRVNIVKIIQDKATPQQSSP